MIRLHKTPNARLLLQLSHLMWSELRWEKIGRDREVAESDIGWVGEGQVQKCQCVQESWEQHWVSDETCRGFRGMYPGTVTQHMLSCKQSSQAPHQVLSFQRGANWSPPLRICFTGLCHVVTRWNISSKPPDVRMGTTCTVILRDHSVLSARGFWNTHLVPLTSGDYVRGLGRKIKAFKMWFYLQLFLQLPGEWSGMGTEIRKDKCRIRNTNTQVSAVISY